MEDKIKNEKLLISDELGEILGLNRVSIYRLRKKGLPCINVGTRAIRYDLQEVRKWLKEEQDFIKTKKEKA